ncbi:MAG TPA: hypothetical protein VGB49_04960, partial [Caulobacteraceae bacterium]
MPGAAVIALAGLLATSASPANDGAAVFGRACLDSIPTSREGLAETARRQGRHAVEGETPEGREWRDIYRAGPLIVRLEQRRADSERLGQTSCAVLANPAPAGWADSVARLPANGGVVGPSDAFYAQPAHTDITVWNLPGGGRIVAAHLSDNDILELSINHPT